MLRRAHLIALALAGMAAFTVPPAEAAPPNKCVINGTVTYQQGPCPAAPGQARQQPTLEQLNAEEKRRRAAAAANKPEQAPPVAATAPAPVATAISKPGGFQCDGRQYCAQMKSCAEAKYFLLNCPGVKMDGDGNGIPCEKQWCSR